VYKKECLENPIFKYYREKLDTYSTNNGMEKNIYLYYNKKLYGKFANRGLDFGF